jgi:excinuclease UvrABC nuclease subunit
MTHQELAEEFEKALASESLTYEQIKSITTCGIYIIYENEKVVYVGKTDRTGKVRLRELASDYRSHTLNRKLLRRLISEFLKIDFPPMNRETKARLIAGKIMSEDNFIKLQKQVNDFIKRDLNFKFYSTEPEKIVRLEHFTIAILNPEMND